ncbi:MAG: peptidylprolyl isomerase [Burkholderiales bacterium]|nr:peptidylprolyl isomerase [Burkholderiales bacterium]
MQLAAIALETNKGLSNTEGTVAMARTAAPDSAASEFFINLVSFISDNPLAGDVIPGAGSLRKVRRKRGGMGKSGGARVIYYTRLANGEVVLVAVYAKAKFDNMPVEVLKAWKEAYDA